MPGRKLGSLSSQVGRAPPYMIGDRVAPGSHVHSSASQTCSELYRNRFRERMPCRIRHAKSARLTWLWRSCLRPNFSSSLAIGMPLRAGADAMMRIQALQQAPRHKLFPGGTLRDVEKFIVRVAILWRESRNIITKVANPIHW